MMTSSVWDGVQPLACLEFVIAANPLPKERPRLGRGRVYTPARTRAYEQLAAQAARAAIMAQGGEWPATGEIALELVFYRATRRRVDLDNLEKALKDALNGVVYQDDSQVTLCLKRKVLGVGRSEARTEVTVRVIREG